MTPAIWLIAEREIRTYVAAASFWAALAVGPLALAGALAFSAGQNAPSTVALHAGDPVLAHAAASALAEAGDLEGRKYAFVPDAPALDISRPQPGKVEVSFGSGFPLSDSGKRLIARTIERDAARASLRGQPVSVHEASAPNPHRLDADALARFALVMILWLTLTGSLGMLLQAVVRERASRSLESLLSVVSPSQIMLGKLAGVGVVSFLVLAVWLGSAAALSTVVPSGADLCSTVLAYLARPAVLIRSAIAYVLAFTFYGSITIAIGAMARDVASAQNLSRPMFLVLLAAFFISLASTTGPASPWLIFLPAFSPFLVLLLPEGSLALVTQLTVLIELAASSLAAAWFAAACLSITAGAPSVLRVPAAMCAGTRRLFAAFAK